MLRCLNRNQCRPDLDPASDQPSTQFLPSPFEQPIDRSRRQAEFFGHLLLRPTRQVVQHNRLTILLGQGVQFFVDQLPVV